VSSLLPLTHRRRKRPVQNVQHGCKQRAVDWHVTYDQTTLNQPRKKAGAYIYTCYTSISTMPSATRSGNTHMYSMIQSTESTHAASPERPRRRGGGVGGSSPAGTHVPFSTWYLSPPGFMYALVQPSLGQRYARSRGPSIARLAGRRREDDPARARVRVRSLEVREERVQRRQRAPAAREARALRAASAGRAGDE
jgi:hypothetical protein